MNVTDLIKNGDEWIGILENNSSTTYNALKLEAVWCDKSGKVLYRAQCACDTVSPAGSSIVFRFFTTDYNPSSDPSIEIIEKKTSTDSKQKKKFSVKASNMTISKTGVFEADITADYDGYLSEINYCITGFDLSGNLVCAGSGKYINNFYVGNSTHHIKDYNVIIYGNREQAVKYVIKLSAFGKK